MLWLWPDASPEGVAASKLASPAVLPDMDSGDFGGNWYMRDLEYGFDSLLENLSGIMLQEIETEGIVFSPGNLFFARGANSRFRCWVCVCVIVVWRAGRTAENAVALF